jgi:NitT/TauT family transport system substrate-binding protein
MGIALSRREVLKSSALLTAAAAFPNGISRVHAATPLKQVSLILDWIHQGPNTGFIVAREKGFYREAGLEVEISPGKGSGSTAQLIASKAGQFGFADGFVVGNSISKGLNIKSVASIYRGNPAAVMVLAESGISTPKDLEGKSIGITAGSAQFQQWPAFAKGAGIDPSKVRLVNVDPAGVGTALLNNQVPAIAAFAQGYVPLIEIRANKTARIFWYADYGVNVVSNGVIVHNDFLKSDPETVRAFLAPTIKGFLYARSNPEEAIELIRKLSPAIDPKIARREMDISWRSWVTPNTRGKELGWSSDVDWEETVKVLKQYGGVTTPLEASQLYTNELVPLGAEYMPPQPA